MCGQEKGEGATRALREKEKLKLNPRLTNLTADAYLTCSQQKTFFQKNLKIITIYCTVMYC